MRISDWSSDVCSSDLEGAGYVAKVFGRDVGLTTQVQTAPAVALQTDGQVTTEQTATLCRFTSRAVVAAFQLENSLQAVAQIFSAFQAPAAAGLNAIGEADFLGFNVIASGIFGFNFVVADTGIDNTVEGDRCFCLSNAEKADGESSSEQSLFHVRNLRRFE